VRSDMSRLIIEDGRRGNGGSKSCYDKIRRVGEEFENLPSFESTSRHRKQDGNSSGDRLMPLKRYLASNVGRPWSKVYSEICAVNDKRTIRGYHLQTHLFQYVYVDGVRRQSYSYGSGSKYGYCDFFVDDNGILKQAPKRDGSRVWWRQQRAKKETENFDLGGGWWYKKIKCLWYYVHYRVIEKEILGHFVTRTSSVGTSWSYTYTSWVNTKVEKETVMDVKVSCGQKDLKEIRKLLAG